MRSFQRALANELADHLPLPSEEIELLLEEPPRPELGDLSLPCFALARKMRKAPAAIAAELQGLELPLSWLAGCQATGPYLNFRLVPGEFAQRVLADVEKQGQAYGTSQLGAGRRVVVDYSSPNIAKHLAVHHLRSTMIGNAIVHLHRACGYEVIGINHLGDWGTNYGQLLTAWERFGSEERLDEASLRASDDPITILNRLYTRFHSEVERNPELEDEARQWFQRLEAGDPVARRRWELIRELSLRKFERIYARLGVHFDEVIGESFFHDRIPLIVEELERQGLLTESQDAQVVPLDSLGIPPMLIRKRDGTTLYGTRDLAAADYRWNEWQFHRCCYVVDAGQALHFRQLFEVLKLLGREYADRMMHVEFGVLRLPVDGSWVKGRTRHGKVVLLEDVLDQAVAKARQEVIARNPDLPDADAISEAVGIGAVILADLKAKRTKDVNFDLDQMCNFDGETGPYLQYTHARLCGILRNDEERGGHERGSGTCLELPEETALLKEISRFPETIERAAEEAEPSVLSQFLLTLASHFNSYYAVHRILTTDSDLATDRVTLVRAMQIVLSHGLRILGIQPLERM